MGLSTDSAALQTLQGHSHCYHSGRQKPACRWQSRHYCLCVTLGTQDLKRASSSSGSQGRRRQHSPGLDPWHPPSQSLPVSFLMIPLAKSGPLLILVNKVLLAVSPSCCLTCGLQLFCALPLQKPGDSDRNQMAQRLICII